MTTRTLPTYILGLIVAGFVLVATLAPATIYAQEQTTQPDSGQFVKCTSTITANDTAEVGLNCDFCDLLKLVNLVTTYAVGILGFVASLMIFISGYLYLTSAGDEHRISQAKTTLKFAIIGFVIAILSGVIVKTVVVQLFFPEGNRPTGASAFGVWDCKDISLPEPDQPAPGAPTPPSTNQLPSGCEPGTQCGAGQRCCDPATEICSLQTKTQQFSDCILQSAAPVIPGLQPTAGTDGCHAVNSCHFGGTCRRGGQAVDYGVPGNKFTAEIDQNFFAKLAECQQKFVLTPTKCRYEVGSTNLGRNYQGADHIHCNFDTAACNCP